MYCSILQQPEEEKNNNEMKLKLRMIQHEPNKTHSHSTYDIQCHIVSIPRCIPTTCTINYKKKTCHA